MIFKQRLSLPSRDFFARPSLRGGAEKSVLLAHPFPVIVQVVPQGAHRVLVPALLQAGDDALLLLAALHRDLVEVLRLGNEPDDADEHMQIRQDFRYPGVSGFPVHDFVENVIGPEEFPVLLLRDDGP